MTSRRPRSRPPLPLLALGAVLLAGCAGPDGEDEPTVALTATSPAGTTATVTATETVNATGAGTDATVAPTSNPDAAVPEGSGCAPGSEDLPDGRWYGQVEEVDDGTLDFNLMCWFVGEEAYQAAEEDGLDALEVPNDYYVRDQNPALREVAWDADATALHHPTGDPADTQELTVAEWGEALAAGDVYFNVWLTVEGGEVTRLEELWVP
ncbi:hypothetical protein [Ornithinimicrobium flavum]|uniref:hypothetical protein n=1 Tax=Ornithinimicrobium flavum TaxID=1288636 RepID=UPI00106F5271|nr:hypothetical protein [Ornithinimicrobium flavum]